MFWETMGLTGHSLDSDELGFLLEVSGLRVLDASATGFLLEVSGLKSRSLGYTDAQILLRDLEQGHFTATDDLANVLGLAAKFGPELSPAELEFLMPY